LGLVRDDILQKKLKVEKLSTLKQDFLLVPYIYLGWPLALEIHWQESSN
jgi:hypothetical protein